MRLGEILALRWSDVDLERKVARVRATLSEVGGEFSLPAAEDVPRTPERRSTGVRRRPPEAAAQAQHEQQMRVRDVWENYGVVLHDPIGRSLAPWGVSADFARWRSNVRRGSATCGTRTLRSCSPPVCIPRPCRSGSGLERCVHNGHLRGRHPIARRAAADAADQLFG
jgi:hypothetical protein